MGGGDYGHSLVGDHLSEEAEYGLSRSEPVDHDLEGMRYFS